MQDNEAKEESKPEQRAFDQGREPQKKYISSASKQSEEDPRACNRARWV
jgi:hypothetical protein